MRGWGRLGVALGGIAFAVGAALVEPPIACGQGERTRPSRGEPPPSEGADAEARRLFAAGEEAYDAGRYEEALNLFTRAHRLSGRPGLLFNIASASERLRRDDQALQAYEEYLRTHPAAANREYVESRIAFLRDQIASEERLRQAALRAETARAREEERRESERAPSGAPRPQAPSPATEADATTAIAPEAIAAPREERDERGGDLTSEWWFWTLVGVAVVGVGVGVGVGVAAATDGGGGGSDPPVQGDFGPGGVVVALEAF